MFFVVPLAGTPSQKGEEGEGKGNAPAKNPREKAKGGNIFSDLDPLARGNGSTDRSRIGGCEGTEGH